MCMAAAWHKRIIFVRKTLKIKEVETYLLVYTFKPIWTSCARKEALYTK